MIVLFPCKNEPIAGIEQRGLALLILVVLLALVSITIYFNSMSVSELKTKQIKVSNKTLANAKKSLIAYAVTRADYSSGDFGFLPCPDLDSNFVEGASHGNCDTVGVSQIGQFPWASLETGLMRSASGSCLWYAVSGDYKFGSPRQDMLNEDTNGMFRVYDADGNLVTGILPESRAVAVIIDPSRPVGTQSRNYDNMSLCGKDYNVSDFLEGNGSKDNSVLSVAADTIDDFIHRNAVSEQRSPPFNDSIEVITRKELWDAVTRRKDFLSNPDSKIRYLTKALAMCVAAYGNNATNRRLPRPVAVDFGANDYRKDGNYDDTSAVSYLGRYPHTVDNSDSDLGVHAPVPGQTVLFDKGFCNALDLGGGVTVNLDTGSGSEYHKLWKNWKDHFFYAVSGYYAPTSAADTGVPSCSGGNCVTVNGVEYAAVVIYSNSRTGVQRRNAPVAGDVDTKNVIANYIEVTDPAGTGSGDYTPTANDIVYCITDASPGAVVSCP